MALDPRTPVIVGVGQLTLHTDTGEASLEPVDMMVEALRRAEADTGATGVLAAASSLAVVRMLSWKYSDPAALVAQRLGIGPLQTVGTAYGGNIPQTLLGRKASEIAAGEHDVVLLAGAEAWRTVTASRRDGTDLRWTVQPEELAPNAEVGGTFEASHPAETARGIRQPIQIYPLFENALRAKAGRSVADHQAHLGAFYSGFSETAIDNPYAWDRRGYSPDEIAVPAPKNRMVGFPYTKLMCSNEQVDESAAMILCSVERARALGIAQDRWVFPFGIAEAAAPLVSERYDLSGSTMADASSRALWDLTGLGPDDIAHVDLYSCFPSAVQVQAGALGLGLDRRLTVTGGMRFSGGPWNNYAMHGLATMVGVLREDPRALGLCSANGGYLSKLSLGVYSATPPDDPFQVVSAQAEVDAGPHRAVDDAPDGWGTIESYTVMHDRAGDATEGILACVMPDGRRAWGIVADDADVLREMTTEDMIGRDATLRPDGRAELD
jgi:acetyl-CoA C-acetyltransferase